MDVALAEAAAQPRFRCTRAGTSCSTGGRIRAVNAAHLQATNWRPTSRSGRMSRVFRTTPRHPCSTASPSSSDSWSGYWRHGQPRRHAHRVVRHPRRVCSDRLRQQDVEPGEQPVLDVVRSRGRCRTTWRRSPASCSRCPRPDASPGNPRSPEPRRRPPPTAGGLGEARPACGCGGQREPARRRWTAAGRDWWWAEELMRWTSRSGRGPARPPWRPACRACPRCAVMYCWPGLRYCCCWDPPSLRCTRYRCAPTASAVATLTSDVARYRRSAQRTTPDRGICVPTVVATTSTAGSRAHRPTVRPTSANDDMAVASGMVAARHDLSVDDALTRSVPRRCRNVRLARIAG